MQDDPSKKTNPKPVEPEQDEEFPGISWFHHNEDLTEDDPAEEKADSGAAQEDSDSAEESLVIEHGPAMDQDPAPRPSLLEPGSELPFLQRDTLFPESQQEWHLSEDGQEEEAEDQYSERDTDSPELGQARRLVRALVKAIKGTRMYPLDNPICRRFANELFDEFDTTFEMMTHVRLTVGKTKIFFRGEPVLEQQGQESVPGRLFWDGIREITYRQGLIKQEVLDFLELFRRDHMDGEEGEDDLVTLFWSQQFEHITYMAVDDLLDLDNPNDPVPEEFGSAFVNFVDIEMHNLEDEEDTFLQASNEMAQEIQKTLQNDDESELFGVARADRDAILREYAVEDSPKILKDILNIISETMFLDVDEESFCDTVAVVAGALEGLVHGGRLMVAAGLVRLLTDLQEDKKDLTPVMADALERGLELGWRDGSLHALVEHLNANLPSMLEGLEEFLDLLPPQATASLCEILGDITHPGARKRLVETLSRRAKTGLVDFSPYLEDSRPEVLRDMLQILGETKNDKVIPHLKRFISHDHEDVRTAALKALARLGPAKAGAILIRALQDPNPKVRLAAVAGLGGAGTVAVPMLVNIIESKDFPDRELKEKKAFFRALGECGGDEVIPILRAILDQRNLFRRASVEEMKACACEALGWVGGKFAKMILEEQAAKKSTMIRSAASSALRRIDVDNDARSAA